MLPILRTIPVGGVFLAIAILLLALNPPRTTIRSARDEIVPARGALIDRGDHPEWRQFLILAALRRADELKQLRDLHDTVVRRAPPTPPAPIATTQEPQTATKTPVVAVPAANDAPQADAKPDTQTADTAKAAPVKSAPAMAAPKPLADAPEPARAEPKVAEATPAEAAGPAPARAKPKAVEAAPAKAAPVEIASIMTTPVETTPSIKPPVDATPIAVAPATVAPTTIAVEPARVAPVDVMSMKPADLPRAMPTPAPHPKQEPKLAAAPAPEKARSAAAHETTGSRITSDLPSPATPPAPQAAKVAVLTTQQTGQQSDDITGSIEQSSEYGSTIPVGIGEASSTEIEVMMPRERPPVLREFDLRRANQSKIEHRRHAVHHRARARRKKTDNAPEQFNLFALLFAPLYRNGRFKPIELNPYQPPQYRSGEAVQ